MSDFLRNIGILLVITGTTFKLMSQRELTSGRTWPNAGNAQRSQVVVQKKSPTNRPMHPIQRIQSVESKRNRTEKEIDGDPLPLARDPLLAKKKLSSLARKPRRQCPASVMSLEESSAIATTRNQRRHSAHSRSSWGNVPQAGP